MTTPEHMASMSAGLWDITATSDGDQTTASATVRYESALASVEVSMTFGGPALERVIEAGDPHAGLMLDRWLLAHIVDPEPWDNEP